MVKGSSEISGKQNAMSTGKVRIVGGKWRGRLLPIADEQGLRPTPDRVRETLFNWLQFEIAGSRCLDLFAGSGVLGFEAVSRGAENVVFLDLSKQVTRILTNNASKFGANNVTILHDDAIRYLRSLAQKKPDDLIANDPVAHGPFVRGPFDIVFVDPP